MLRCLKAAGTTKRKDLRSKAGRKDRPEAVKTAEGHEDSASKKRYLIINQIFINIIVKNFLMKLR